MFIANDRTVRRYPAFDNAPVTRAQEDSITAELALCAALAGCNRPVPGRRIYAETFAPAENIKRGSFAFDTTNDLRLEITVDKGPLEAARSGV